jgi:hypothetical protein
MEALTLVDYTSYAALSDLAQNVRGEETEAHVRRACWQAVPLLIEAVEHDLGALFGADLVVVSVEVVVNDIRSRQGATQILMAAGTNAGVMLAICCMPDYCRVLVAPRLQPTDPLYLTGYQRIAQAIGDQGFEAELKAISE